MRVRANGTAVARLALLCTLGSTANSTPPASAQMKARTKPAPLARCLGSPHAGRLENGMRLQARPYLRIKRRSRARAWGHPLLVQMLDAGARAAGARPGAPLLVGDLSARLGGPLSGHASHQQGLDADIGFFATDSGGETADLAAFVSFNKHGKSSNGLVFDSRRNWLMLQSWLSDLRAPSLRIFVSAPLRALLLDYARAIPELRGFAPRAGRVLRPHAAHADHFHLRIGCPSDQ